MYIVHFMSQKSKIIQYISKFCTFSGTCNGVVSKLDKRSAVMTYSPYTLFCIKRWKYCKMTHLLLKSIIQEKVSDT